MCNWLSRAYCLSLVILGGLYMKPAGFQIFTIICGLPDDSHKTGDGVPYMPRPMNILMTVAAQLIKDS